MLSSGPAPHPDDFDPRDPAMVCAAFDAAAAANRDDPRRSGSLIHLPPEGRLLVSGDLHDHRGNLAKLLGRADLAAGPDRMLVLQEVIHGPHKMRGMDLSVRILAEIACLRASRPGQVWVLQSNHELAQYLGRGITKGGASVCEAFDQGLEFMFAGDAPAVTEAMRRYLRSLPLALRTPHDWMLTHSLPSENRLPRFDPGVLDREPTDADLDGGAAHLLVWGRGESVAVQQHLAEAWRAQGFVVGHQACDFGTQPLADRGILVASDHRQGAALEIDLARAYDRDALYRQAVMLMDLPTPSGLRW
ncbi:MAG: hypothetical protein AAF612_01040 [Planctomycetota bacterium]